MPPQQNNRLHMPEIVEPFWADEQLRLNARRLECLASLGLNVHGRSVLEVGGGIGDLSRFFLDRHCRLVMTDARLTNLRAASVDDDLPQDKNYRQERLDLDSPGSPKGRSFDIVFCFGVPHLLKRPERALDFMAKVCTDLLLVECEIEPGESATMRVEDAPKDDPVGSFAGARCRMTRPWLVAQLAQRMKFVYEPVEPPAHPCYAADASSPRSMLIASHSRLDLRMLRPATA